jgi:arabinose-5-phosphate isomerase
MGDSNLGPLELARELLRIEALAIENAARKLDASFSKSVDFLFAAHEKRLKIILLGVGKSHYVAQKIAASFMSTGVTALFVHPGEALHGDLGVIRPQDLCILISKSGSTPELLSILPFFKDRNPTIGITGNPDSPIAKQCDLCLDASVEKEACPINLLPSASTTVALAIGDALVASLLSKTGFTREDFAYFHPGGSLGKRLNHKVQEVLKPLPLCATAFPDATLTEVAKLMGERPLGACCIVSEKNDLRGIVSEGDLRRAIARGLNFNSRVQEIMTSNPVTLSPEMLIEDALSLMEQNNRKVGSAPVVGLDRKLLGMVRIHDLI